MAYGPDGQGAAGSSRGADGESSRLSALGGSPLEVQRFEAGPLCIVALGVAIFLSGCLTLLLPRGPGQFAPIGLVDSVLLAALLMVRRERWPWIVGAAFVGEMFVGPLMPAPLDLSIAMTVCSLVASTLTAHVILKILGDKPDMARVPNVLRYVVTVAVAALGGALLASGVRAAIAGAPLWPNILVWASRDFTGMATLTPCFILIANRTGELKGLLTARAWPLAVLAVVEAATFFTDRMPLTYLLIAALLLVTWRLRIAGAVVGILMTFLFAVPATLSGHGPFAAFPVSPAEQLLSMQFFLAVSFHITVPVAAQLARSRHLQQALGDALTSIHESEGKHRLVTENMRDVVAQVDREGRLAYISPSVRLLGYVPEEMVGRPGEDIVHPDDVPRFLDNAAYVLSGRPDNGRDHRFRLRLRDGRYRWFEGSPTRLTDAMGQSAGLVSVLRDVHQQRQADEALAASEARYRLLADNMNDIIACYRSDGVITHVSGATETILGFRPDELIGRQVDDRIHPDELEACLAIFQRQREAGPAASAFHLDYRFARKDGSWVWLQANPRGLFDEHGEFVEWQDVIRDISAGKALEAELRTARATADAAARSKADFLADMGHEVRGPLNSVVGFARIARSQPERAEWCMDCIEEAARSLLTMVGDILDYSRLEAAQVQFRSEPVRVPEFMRSVVAQMEPQARAKDLQVRLVDDSDATCVVATDANRLRQVLINLLGNAVKFTHEGEVVLEVRCDCCAGRLDIEVRDTGPGVPADQLGDLFERFSPAQPSGGHAPGGVGLGLAISKSIVEGLGGQISAESEPGRGSTFRFWVPAPGVDEADGVDAAGTPSPMALRIMVATAEPELQALVQGTMARRAEVLPADDLAAATRLAAHEPLDLIIVDLALARGPSTLRRLRKASGPNSHTPALAFSHETSDELHARALGQGFQGLLAKASSSAELVSGVAEALLSAELWGRPSVEKPARGGVGRWRRERTGERALSR